MMRSEPRVEMRAEPRTADPLAGLAAELARAQSEPPPPAPKARPSREREPVREREPTREREAPRARAPQPERPAERLRPVPPAAADEPMAPAANADQNLAEMAQRLEAALRRPKQAAEQPRAPEAAARSAMMTAPSTSESMMEPDPIPMMTEPVAANEDAPPAQPHALTLTRGMAGKPAAQKSVYDSLEQEMASLLGRPNTKA